MKFLADENVERSVVDLLRKSGLDVLYVSDDSPGCTDVEVLKLANRQKRILITNDTDFGELVFRQGHVSSGILLMRFNSESLATKIEVVSHVLKFHINKLQNHFTVLNERQIKIRPLG